MGQKLGRVRGMRVSCRHLQARSITDMLCRMIVLDFELDERPLGERPESAVRSSKPRLRTKEKSGEKSLRPGAEEHAKAYSSSLSEPLESSSLESSSGAGEEWL